ncbi:peptidoglycan editing factor PgeF [Candidatus Omnitrophota bacterium]
MKRNSIRFFKKKNYPFIAAFSDKTFNFSFRNFSKRTIRKNRKAFFDKLNIDCKDLILPQQVHSARVVSMGKKHRGRGAFGYRAAIKRTDGLFTQEKNLPLGVLTADCLAISLFDPATKTACILHAGWKGSNKRIAQKAIARLQRKYKINPKDLIVFFGPAIRSCCYEVGSEFKNYFSQRFLIRNGDKLFFDLIKANASQLLKAGVRKKNIFDCKICTCCDKRFFSYRREGKKTGRMISVIIVT